MLSIFLNGSATIVAVIGINLLLSGDNAIVLALACRALPQPKRRWAMTIGATLALVLQVALTFVAAGLIGLPVMRLVGSGILMHIAVKLLVPEGNGVTNGEDGCPEASLWSALRTVLIADLVMSADNILAIAAVADGQTLLMAAGLLVSTPLVIVSSNVILRLISRMPWIIAVGAGLLGWVAGGMALSDPLWPSWLAEHDILNWAIPAVAALSVVVVGRRLATERPFQSVDLPDRPDEAESGRTQCKKS